MKKNITIKKNNMSITNFIIMLLFSFASLDLFQYDGKTFFFYIELIFLVYLILFRNNGKICLLKDPLIIAIFLEFFLSGILAQLENMNGVYKKTAIVMPILVLPIFFLSGFLGNLIYQKKETIYWIKRGIKIACVIQFVYIPIQYVFYHAGNIDINKLIFVDILRLTPSASFIRDWVWYPSGVTNHSAIIAPLMVLGLVLFKNLYFRLLILLDSFLCGSSSAIVGVCVTILLLFFFGLIEKGRNSKVKRKVLLSIVGIVIFLAVILLTTNILNIILDKIGYIIIRLFSDSKDSSTNAHLLYYYKYPSIFKDNSILQNIFGYGYGCSGYIFSMLDNRINIGSWAVETDIMDRLYSLGILGFVLYYIFLSKILIRGYHIDKKYTIVMISIIIQGLGYNVQWDYIFLIELIFYICIKNKISFFNSYCT